MIKWILSVLLFCFFRTLAQEWVDVTNEYIVNSSFEEYKDCPTSNSDYPNSMWIDSCVGWTAPTLGTSDYFNSCNTNLFNSVPYNSAAGFQYAFDGEAYCGFLAYSLWNNTMWSEYIQTTLINTLQLDQFYKFSFRISRANGYNLSVKNIGANFSKNNLKNYTSANPLKLQPTIINQSGALHDTLNWQLIEGVFQAKGDEKFLTIGWFGDTITDDKSFLTLPIIDELTGDSIYLTEIYYLVDSLKLFKLNNSNNIVLHLPNILTINQDNVNDFYFYSNILIKEFEYEIYNRWGQLIFQDSNPYVLWNGKDLSGVNLNEGVYFLRIKYTSIFNEVNYLNQFIQLIK